MIWMGRQSGPLWKKWSREMGGYSPSSPGESPQTTYKKIWHDILRQNRNKKWARPAGRLAQSRKRCRADRRARRHTGRGKSSRVLQSPLGQTWRLWTIGACLIVGWSRKSSRMWVDGLTCNWHPQQFSSHSSLLGPAGCWREVPAPRPTLARLTFSWRRHTLDTLLQNHYVICL